jgi:D-glycero-beta-D-manno-heptose-7-phosphate kinase
MTFGSSAFSFVSAVCNNFVSTPMDQLSLKIRDSFPEKKIVIAGDLVADQFLQGTIARVSREAPVFILRHDETDTRGGAAANAAANIAALGAKPVLVGLVGTDETGDRLVDVLRGAGVDCDHIAADASRRTTKKVRVLAGQHYAARQQVIRIDYENSGAIDTTIRERLLSNLSAAADGADAIVVSDYNYGVAERELFDLASKISRERAIPLLVDSRYRLAEFPNAAAATPNQEEVEQLIGGDLTIDGCTGLRERLGVESLLVTRGNKGMLLFENGREPLALPPVGSTEPVDVTGAGDTVIAVYSLALASGLSCADAARAANHAGGIVVMKKGTASVSMAELLESISKYGEPGTLGSSA